MEYSKFRKRQALHWYWELIRKGIARAKPEYKKIKYREEHHIIPKYMIDDHELAGRPWNKVFLTVREHVMAHKLLYIAGAQMIPTSNVYEACTLTAAVRILGTKKVFVDVFVDEDTDRARELYDYMVDRGCTPIIAKGVIHRLLHDGFYRADKRKLQ